jgi:hypothetical protein
LYFSLAIFFGLLIASWITHGRGVIKNDPARGIDIPSERFVGLQVKAAFDGKQVYMRYRWPTPKRVIEYDMLRYEGGKWARDGQGKSQGDYEDRVSTMIDDGSVPEFGRYGAYVMANRACGPPPTTAAKTRSRLTPTSASRRASAKSASTCRPRASARPTGPQVVPEPELARLRSAGYFVDLWQWHVNRTNPIGKADDGVVAEARYSDSGKGVLFATNWVNSQRAAQVHVRPEEDRPQGARLERHHERQAGRRRRHAARRPGRSLRREPGVERTATRSRDACCAAATARPPTSTSTARAPGRTAIAR